MTVSGAPVVCTRVRSTLLLASANALRTRGHFERYRSRLPNEAHDAIFALGAPSWLPLRIAEDHYTACEDLQLPNEEILRVGSLVAPIDASGVQIVLGAAQAGGVTPWTLLENANRYWGRMYEGSAVRVARDGPKDARVMIVKNPLARFPYWRIGLRGIVGELTRALSTRAYVREAERSNDGVTYSLSWA